MNSTKKTAIAYYITAAISYICAIIWFIRDKSNTAFLWLCLGSANLSLGSVWRKRSKAEQEQPAGETQDETAEDGAIANGKAEAGPDVKDVEDAEDAEDAEDDEDDVDDMDEAFDDFEDEADDETQEDM